MKRTFINSSLAIIAVLSIAACRQGTSASGDDLGSIIKPSPARPSIIFCSLVKRGDIQTSALCVMDYNGSHQTPVLIGTDTNIEFQTPGWSGSGRSICVVQSGNGVVPDTLKAMDISVDAAGDIHSDNIRTLLGTSKAGSINGMPYGESIGYPRWSSTPQMGKIAFSYTHEDTIKMCIMPESGGQPQVIWSSWAWENYLYCAWSPDDSKLAVCRINGGYGSNYIMIFNTSTWQCVDSVKVSGMIWGLDWSRNGLNKLAFARAASVNGMYYLTYCDPKYGAVPTSNGVPAGDPSWSPDNSSLVCLGNDGLMTVKAFTHDITIIKPNHPTSGSWKR